MAKNTPGTSLQDLHCLFTFVNMPRLKAKCLCYGIILQLSLFSRKSAGGLNLYKFNFT